MPAVINVEAQTFGFLDFEDFLDSLDFCIDLLNSQKSKNWVALDFFLAFYSLDYRVQCSKHILLKSRLFTFKKGLFLQT